jgi:hypothetical protein
MRREPRLIECFSMFFMSTAFAAPDQCSNLVRKVCKSPRTGACEVVYVAAEQSSAVCRRLSWRKIETVCGAPDAKLFDTDAECVTPGRSAPEAERSRPAAVDRAPPIEQPRVQPRQDAQCPVSFSSIRQRDVAQIASCMAIQKDVCRNVCGARYDTLDVRNFGQTRGQPGLLCQDTSTEPPNSQRVT